MLPPMTTHPKLTRREREALKAEWRSELARQGGLARAAKLTPKQRSEAARKAARMRWEQAK